MRSTCDRFLTQIELLFSDPVIVTLVIRNTAHPDGSRDVWMGNDDAESVTEVMRRLGNDT
jgi:hypothetical protein